MMFRLSLNIGYNFLNLMAKAKIKANGEFTAHKTIKGIAVIKNIFIYVVYDHPSDYPYSYVLKRFTTFTGTPIQDTSFIIKSDSLVPIREYVQKKSLTRLERHPKDDPVILECWI
jgi:hypothetical protein